jgi:small subunit ribosomal protein S16
LRPKIEPAPVIPEERVIIKSLYRNTIMPVKIRLARRGRKAAAFYHIVIADSRSPRDGRFIEKVGTYNPMTIPASIEIDRTKAYDWLVKGAQPTDTVKAILRYTGVLYWKHLMRGVGKGLFTEEQAVTKFDEWMNSKSEKISAYSDATKAKKEQRRLELSGTPKPKVVKAEEPAVIESPETGSDPEWDAVTGEGNPPAAE